MWLKKVPNEHRIDNCVVCGCRKQQYCESSKVRGERYALALLDDNIWSEVAVGGYRVTLSGIRQPVGAPHYHQ